MINDMVHGIAWHGMAKKLTIIPLAFVGFKMVIANCISLAIYTFSYPTDARGIVINHNTIRYDMILLTDYKMLISIFIMS